MAARHRAASPSDLLHEKGAVAVEFALILPIFLMLCFGIIEFGRAYNIQVSLSEAARETARYTAIHSSKAGFSESDAKEVGISAAPSVPLAPSNIGIAYSGGSACTADKNVVVTIQVVTPYLTGLPGLVPGLPANLDISSKGVMRCGG